ncbi:MAG: hypothetical protein F2894_03700 [Actinobacteria bacterium]|uniref:Unannotated protein n=1 Tax=freshwater metagenome TaxID=449393 RepID=A0A6J7MDS1_9ZZZZ|nr:hypothetical protein [Actinomycetota bacterium]MSW05295.1 hypothetical protein [Actinomycetota bacterium]MSX82365.1 hypothetical protein [Actinomycetota bacterium]
MPISTTEETSISSSIGPVFSAVLRHPSLWPTAIGAAFRLSPKGWWMHAPFLPIPDRAYLEFRIETQYGSNAEPVASDVVSYLRWCRDEARRSAHSV